MVILGDFVTFVMCHRGSWWDLVSYWWTKSTYLSLYQRYNNCIYWASTVYVIYKSSLWSRIVSLTRSDFKIANIICRLMRGLPPEECVLDLRFEEDTLRLLPLGRLEEGSVGLQTSSVTGGGWSTGRGVAVSEESGAFQMCNTSSAGEVARVDERIHIYCQIILEFQY